MVQLREIWWCGTLVVGRESISQQEPHHTHARVHPPTHPPTHPLHIQTHTHTHTLTHTHTVPTSGFRSSTTDLTEAGVLELGHT
jgi:hypothetical protein